MDEEVAATLEVENQILAAATHVRDALSLQRGCDCLRRLGPGQAAVCNGQRVKRRPVNAGASRERIVSTSGSSGTRPA